MSSTSPHRHRGQRATFPFTNPLDPPNKEHPRTNPWPLQLAVSSHPKFTTPQELTHEPQPSAPFIRIDEELPLNNGKTASQNSTSSQTACSICQTPSEDDDYDQERDRGAGGRLSPRELLMLFLLLCAVVILVSPPALVFVFARREWGLILLKKEAPSETVLAGVLALLAAAVAATCYIGVVVLLSLPTGNTVIGSRVKVAGHVGVGLGFGAALAGWLIVWLYPLLGHA